MKYQTYLDGHERAEQPNVALFANPTYKTISEVPKPLRENIKRAHESGVTAEQLGMIYDMSLDWIALFVFDAQGNA